MTEHNENTTGNGEIRENLREAGEAIVAAIGKFAESLPEKFKNASESARETLNAATSEGEIRSLATNFTNEAEKVFNQLREGDLKFTEDAVASVRGTVEDVRTAFNERMDKIDTEGAENLIQDLRSRFDGLVERIQDQFSDDAEKADIIEGEIVDDKDTNKDANEDNA